MVVDTVAEAIDLAEVLRECEIGVFTMKVGNDFVDSGRNFEEERVVDEFSEAVKRELIKALLSEKQMRNRNVPCS